MRQLIPSPTRLSFATPEVQMFSSRGMKRYHTYVRIIIGLLVSSLVQQNIYNIRQYLPLLPGGDAADHLIETMKNAGSWQSN
ncbi:hypothetical protein ACFX16_025857 [Malus domestica]